MTRQHDTRETCEALSGALAETTAQLADVFAVLRLMTALAVGARLHTERRAQADARYGSALAKHEREVLCRALDGEDVSHEIMVPGARACLLDAIAASRKLGHAITRSRLRAGAMAIVGLAIERELDALVAMTLADDRRAA